MAAIRDVSGSDWESVSLAANPRFRNIIEESRRAYRQDGGITLDDLRAELGFERPAKHKRKKKA